MGTGFESDPDLPHGAAIYSMGDMGKKKGKQEDEDNSLEDDQKHILHSGSVKTGSDGHEGEGPQGDWITKTIEYTVSDVQSMNDPHDHAR